MDLKKLKFGSVSVIKHLVRGYRKSVALYMNAIAKLLSTRRARVHLGYRLVRLLHFSNA